MRRPWSANAARPRSHRGGAARRGDAGSLLRIQAPLMPEIPRFGPGRVVPIARVQPGDVGGGAGDRAFGQTSDMLSQAAASLFEAEQTAKVASGIAAASAKLEEFRLAEEQNPDHEGREGRFETYRAKVVGEFRQQIRGRAHQQ